MQPNHPFGQNKTWKSTQYQDLETPSEIPDDYQEISNTEHEQPTSNFETIPNQQHAPFQPMQPMQPMYLPVQGPNGIVYMPMALPPHMAGMPGPVPLHGAVPIQMPMHPMGMYPQIPQGIPQGQAMYSYPVMQRQPEGPGLFEQIKGYFRGMNQAQRLAFSLRICNLLLVWMFILSIKRMRRTGSGGTIALIFSVIAMVANMITSCALKSQNLARLEKGIGFLTIMSGLAFYNAFIFILLGGFHYLGVKFFFMILGYGIWTVRNVRRLKRFRDEVAMTQWVQPQ